MTLLQIDNKHVSKVLFSSLINGVTSKTIKRILRIFKELGLYSLLRQKSWNKIAVWTQNLLLLLLALAFGMCFPAGEKSFASLPAINIQVNGTSQSRSLIVKSSKVKQWYIFLEN